METQPTQVSQKKMGSEFTGEKEIRDLMEDFTNAFMAKDLNRIMSFYAQDVVAYDVVDTLQYSGKESYKQSWKEFLEMSGVMNCETRDQRIFADDKLGFCHTLNHVTGTMKNGQKTDMWMRSTTCLQKMKGEWKIVHEHLSEPVDFENGKILMNLKPEKSLKH